MRLAKQVYQCINCEIKRTTPFPISDETNEIYCSNCNFWQPEFDYAHCADCDRVINLDTDIWTADENDTFCEICTKDRKVIARI